MRFPWLTGGRTWRGLVNPEQVTNTVIGNETQVGLCPRPVRMGCRLADSVLFQRPVPEGPHLLSGAVSDPRVVRGQVSAPGFPSVNSTFPFVEPVWEYHTLAPFQVTL